MRLLPLAVSTVCLAWSSVSFADDAKPSGAALDACLSAAQDGQAFRDTGKLLAARGRFAECLRESCPGGLRKDCDRFLADTDARLPSVVLRVRRSSGEDILDVQSTLDGQPLEKLDGRAIPLDPGRHVFTARLPGGASLNSEFLLREGEKNRQVDLVDQSAPVESGGKGRTIVTYALLGVSALSFAAFGFFGIRGLNNWTSLTHDCRPRCATSDVDDTRRDFLIADVTLGVGLAALVGATALLVTAPKPAATAGRALPSPALPVGRLSGGWSW